MAEKAMGSSWYEPWVDFDVASFSLSPQLVWGLIPRFVGFLHVLAFASFAPQAQLMLGARGVLPIAKRLEHIERHFPGPRRFFEHPTVFWLNRSDGAVSFVAWLGVLCGLVAMFGGPTGYAALALAWILWLSFEPAGSIFPWDTMLYEVSFLVLFLPVVPYLPNVLATDLPFPTVTFMFRWLVLRLMLGFGKVKFLASRKEDSLYLHGFFVWMPSPTRLAWFGHHLPHFVLRSMLYFMFAAEVIAPILGFFSGPLRLVSFALLVGLMFGIQISGNWGFFNIGYMLLCLCLLDTQASLFDIAKEPWASQALTGSHALMHALLLLMFLTSLIYLVIADSWITRTFIHWPFDNLVWNRAWARGLIKYLRAVAPLRLINGYGVFPPRSGPALRLIPCFEGSDDGVTWQAYRYKFLPTSPNEPPPFVSPHHPRIDMAMVYAGACTHDASFYGSLLGDGTPYACWTPNSWLDRFAQHLLNAEPKILSALRTNPFPDQPPKFVRASAIAISPSTPAERRATGAWWRTRRVGTLIPARGREPWMFDMSLSEPEQFHPDWLDYKRRSAPIRAMVAAFQGGATADEAVRVHSDFTADEVRAFWDEVIPQLADGRGDLTRLATRAEQLRATYPGLRINRIERLLERFAWLLRTRTERHHFADAQPKIAIESNFRYSLFLHDMVLDGKAAYGAALVDPSLAAARVSSSTDGSQLWALALLRYDLMLAHIRAFRWYLIGPDCYELKVPGLFEYYPTLVAYVPPEEDFCPKLTKHPDGTHSIEDFYPTRRAPDRSGPDNELGSRPSNA